MKRRLITLLAYRLVGKPLHATGAILAGLFLLLAWPAVSPAAWERIDSPMYRDPDLSTPVPIYFLDEKTRALWLRALKRPEADLRVKAADAFALAHRLKATGMDG